MKKLFSLLITCILLTSILLITALPNPPASPSIISPNSSNTHSNNQNNVQIGQNNASLPNSPEQKSFLPSYWPILTIIIIFIIFIIIYFIVKRRGSNGQIAKK